MPYQVSMMGWVGWRFLWVGLGFWKSDPWPTLLWIRHLLRIT